MKVGKYDFVDVNMDFITSTDRECMLIGPYRTGKTISICAKAHHLCIAYPGTICLMLTEYRMQVQLLMEMTYYHFFASKSKEVKTYKGKKQVFTYDNGSRVYACRNDDEFYKAMEADFIGVLDAGYIGPSKWIDIQSRLNRSTDIMPYTQIAGELSIDPDFENPENGRISIPNWIMYRNSINLFRIHPIDNPSIYSEGEFTDIGNHLLTIYPNLAATEDELQYYN